MDRESLFPSDKRPDFARAKFTDSTLVITRHNDVMRTSYHHLVRLEFSGAVASGAVDSFSRKRTELVGTINPTSGEDSSGSAARRRVVGAVAAASIREYSLMDKSRDDLSLRGSRR